MRETYQRRGLAVEQRYALLAVARRRQPRGNAPHPAPDRAARHETARQTRRPGRAVAAILGYLGRVLSWLRGGYPEQGSGHGHIALFALMPEREVGPASIEQARARGAVGPRALHAVPGTARIRQHPALRRSPPQ